MKLKEGFILHNVGDEYMVVATGDAGKLFNGLVRNNVTANFIFEKLLQETTEELIVDAMMEKYDASREQIESDVKRVVNQIREAGFLDE